MSKSVTRKRRSRGKVFKTIGRSFKSLFNRIPRFGSRNRSRSRKNTRKRSRKQRGGWGMPKVI